MTPVQCFQVQCAISIYRSYHVEWNVTDHGLVSPSKDADRFSCSHRRGFMTVEANNYADLARGKLEQMESHVLLVTWGQWEVLKPILHSLSLVARPR